MLVLWLGPLAVRSNFVLDAIFLTFLTLGYRYVCICASSCIYILSYSYSRCSVKFLHSDNILSWLVVGALHPGYI